MDNSLWARQVKVLFYLYSAFAMAFYAYLNLQLSHADIAILTALLCVTLSFSTTQQIWLSDSKSSMLSDLLAFFLIWLMADYTSRVVENHYYWLFLPYLFAYFVFPVLIASVLVTFYSIVTLFPILQNLANGDFHLIIPLITCIGIGMIFGLLNDLYNEILEPLINVDQVTHFFNQQKLPYLLNQEISRANREGYILSVVKIDTSFVKSNKLMESIADRIRDDVRPFDSLFKLNDNRIIILLPYLTEQQSIEQAKQIAKAIRTIVKKEPVLEVAALNVGDDHKSLLASLGVKL